MKKNIKAFLLVLVTVVLMCCQSEDKYIGESKITVNTVDLDWDTTKIRTLIPLKIYEENDMLNVLFFASPKEYTLNLNSKDALAYSKMLYKALDEKVPVKFNVDENNDFITKLRATTDNERIEYNENRSPKRDSTTLRSTAVSPSDIVYPHMVDTDEAAVDAFNLIMANAKQENINFNYIGDGCQARAHKMKKILQDHNYNNLKKIFAYPGQNNSTLAGYNGECCAFWDGFHVAIVVSFKYNTSVSGPREKKYIIDPGLFNVPVSEAEWRTAITRSSCPTSKSISIDRICEVDAEYYYYYPYASGYNDYDRYYNKTNEWLNVFVKFTGCNRYQ